MNAWKELPNIFSIRFSIRNNNKEQEDNQRAGVGINDGVSVGIDFGINETQRKILDLMLEDPSITAAQLAYSIGITKRPIESNIRKLKALGLVERTGARRNGQWIVKQPK